MQAVALALALLGAYPRPLAVPPELLAEMALASGVAYDQPESASFLPLGGGTVSNLGVGQTFTTTNRIIVPLENDAATPTIGFGDADTGFYESADDTLNVATAGSLRLQITGAVIAAGTSMQFRGSTTNNFGFHLAAGGATEGAFVYSTTQTPDSSLLLVGTTSRTISLVESGDQTTDLAFAQQTNPTFVIQSADATAPTKRLYMAHNQTDAIHAVDSGDHGFQDDGGKGVTTYIRTNTETLTFAGGGGDASKTTSALVPDGAFLLGVTTRVTTTGTTCTSVDIGDGTDVDMFGDNTGVTAGTTTDNSGATAQFARAPATAAMNVTITGVGGNCVSGVWRVTAHYIQPAAATSN